MATRLVSENFNTIWKEIQTEYYLQTDEVLDKASEDGIILSVLAYAMRKDRININWAFRQNLIDEAENIYLEKIGEFLGVERGENQPATTTLRFTFTSALPVQQTIYAGTQVKSTDGVMTFATDTDTVCDTGLTYVDIEATATEGGEKGNSYSSGTVSNIVDNVPFVDTVENTTTTEGGAEEETDERYRTRLKLAYSSKSTAGTQESIKFWTYTYDNSIISVTVPEAGTAGVLPGEIHVYPLLKDGVVPSTSYLSDLEEYLNSGDIKPTCVTLVCKKVTQNVRRINMRVYYFEGYDLSVLQPQIEAALTDYTEVLQTTVGHDFVATQARATVMQFAGVKDCELFNDSVPLAPPALTANETVSETEVLTFWDVNVIMELATEI